MKLIPRRHLVHARRKIHRIIARLESFPVERRVHCYKDVVVQGEFDEPAHVQVFVYRNGKWVTVLDLTASGFGSLLNDTKGHTLRIVVEGASTGYVEVV